MSFKAFVPYFVIAVTCFAILRCCAQERIKSWLTAGDAEERRGNLEPGVNPLVIPDATKS